MHSPDAALPRDVAPGLAARARRAVVAFADLGCIGLLGAEALLLFAGVIARYLVHRPLVWADELAATLLVWLTMLGAVAALHRRRHMRLHVAGRLFGHAALPRIADLVGVLVFAALVAMALAGLALAREESGMRLPAFDMPIAWRTAALPAAAALMAALQALGWLESGRPKLLGLAVALALATCVAGLLLAGLTGAALGNANLVLFFVVLLGALLCLDLPIAFAFALSTLGYAAFAAGVPTLVVAARMIDGMSHVILLAIPLFVLLGLVMEHTGMASALVDFLANLVGHVRGGLSYVLIGAMYLVSGISGSKAADMAAVAPPLLPEMQKRGENPGELAALLAATGAQTETIPPSLVLITVGSVTGISIAALFVGGLLPAAVVGAVLCGAVAWRARPRGDSAAPAQRVRAAPRVVATSLLLALPALCLPALIRAAVVGGVATATEVSAIAIAYALLVGLVIYRRLDWRQLGPMMLEAATLSAAIVLIIGAATAMGWALVRSGFGAGLAQAMAQLPGGAIGFLALSIVVFIVLGSVLEGLPAVVLLAPLLFPVAKSLGLHPVHYSMVVILALGLGLFAPPLGVGYYTACAIARIDPAEAMPYIWGYLWPVAVGLLLVAAFPWLSTGFL